MSRSVLKWKVQELAVTIVATLLNKYDLFMVIEGGTGIGKSTLAYQIATQVAREFKRLYKFQEDRIEYYYERVGRVMGLTEEEFVMKINDLRKGKKYRFFPSQALIYTQDELQKSLASWQEISIPDEMINITFNRDFYSEKQKDIIKMLNMFRDHENLTIACVPMFQNLDTQIKNLCKMKITVKKRGIAIIHTPNAVVYSKDKWDQATNEKIEKEWIRKKKTRPNYSKLTTFRGLVRFRALTKDQEEKYQKIKDEKRSIVLKVDMKIENRSDPFSKFLKKLIDGGIRNGDMLRGFADGIDVTVGSLRGRMVKELELQNKPTMLTPYFWGNSKKDRDANKDLETELGIQGL